MEYSARKMRLFFALFVGIIFSGCFCENTLSFIEDFFNDTTTHVVAEKDVGCGYRNPDGVGFRITGADTIEAEFGEFPWVAAILREVSEDDEILKLYSCGGAILAPTVIITSAACLKNYEPNELKVRVGEWDTQLRSEVLPHIDVYVKEIIIHENFNKTSFINDVALMILQQPIEWADNIRPICLPPSTENFDNSNCFMSGWGKDKFGKDGLYQVILKKINPSIVIRDQCQNSLRTTRLGQSFQLHDSFICAKVKQGNDVCTGDEGSALVCPIKGTQNRFYHAGIVSWGIECGKNGSPSAYTSVTNFRSWIDRQLTAKGINFSHFTA